MLAALGVYPVNVCVEGSELPQHVHRIKPDPSDHVSLIQIISDCENFTPLSPSRSVLLALLYRCYHFRLYRLLASDLFAVYHLANIRPV